MFAWLPKKFRNNVEEVASTGMLNGRPAKVIYVNKVATVKILSEHPVIVARPDDGRKFLSTVKGNSAAKAIAEE